MNRHALAILEFPRLLEVVAQYAASGIGAERVRGSEPSADVPWVESELARVAAMRALIASEPGWAAQPIPDLRQPLRRLAVSGTVWTGQELVAGVALLRSSRMTRAALEDGKREAAATNPLRPFAERLLSQPATERNIERAVDDDGAVRDDASPALRRFRRELRSAESDLVHLLERTMARLEANLRVPDMSVTVRNGRYVIPVRREAKSVVGGLVHDSSSTGATLFIEPPAAIEACNRIRELEVEERAEVERILAELTDALRPMAAALADALEALTELDSLYARARFADAYQAAPAAVALPGAGFAVHAGRHPLLQAQGIPVVPFDLAMDPPERTLLVSGPNTGGKTVLLKALGTLSAMTAAGIPATVAPGSRLPIYDDIFADVGDEQSIEASLSTFSAHLKNLREILSAATTSSMVLVDELGSGTDPVEGAALGGAILEELTRRGTLTIATTHLGSLKDLAAHVPGVVNAALHFDDVALAPTYHLVKGIPGRSYGISIARRLGLPDAVLARAEARLPESERNVDALLMDLERRASELTAREQLVASDEESGRSHGERIAERERAVALREREFERGARRDARRYVLEMRDEVEQTVRELKGATDVGEGARSARRRMERLVASQTEALDALEAGDESSPGEVRRPPAVGDMVEVALLEGRSARLLEMRGHEAVVALGTVRVTVPAGGLRRASRQESGPAVKVPTYASVPDVDVATEIDVRGMRVEEMDGVVMLAVDAAISADLKSLRIIHGKGTGVLRARVAELLSKDTRVRSHRSGAWNEGGTGVTMADLA